MTSKAPLRGMMLALSVALAVALSVCGANAWSMRPVTSYQARVETYAPVWDEEHEAFVSGLPTSSSGKNLTFAERYADTLDSVTTSSVEGALLYLQRDCIDRGADPSAHNCTRKHNVSVVTFLEVQIVQPNAALAEYQEQRYMYPEFCPYVVMEDGECAYADTSDSGDAGSDNSSGSRDHPPECKQFNGLDGQPHIGPCVGAQAFSADMVAPYVDAVWFSYPNSCVTSSWTRGKSASCREERPGGLCAFGTQPDGVTCTFSYKILGYLSIDELVGITSIEAGVDTNASSASDSDSSSYRLLLSAGKTSMTNTTARYFADYYEFCEAGNVEFHSFDQDKTLGLSNVSSIPFWAEPSMLERNVNRTQEMIALYNALATADNSHMQQLPMDLEAVREANPPCYENAITCYKALFGCERHSYAQVCSLCREQKASCERQVPSYSFPTLDKASRSVADSELRSGIFAKFATVSATTTTDGSTSNSNSNSTSTAAATHAPSGLAASAVALLLLLRR